LTELETGCTCVTFDTHGKPSGSVCVCRRLPTPPADPIIACLPLRRRLTLRMPSRIRPLLHELLLVLLSIISPQTALVSTSPQSGRISIQQRRKQQQEQAQALRAVLDVDLIEQEMRHGLFDPSGAFEVIGQILKSHCAPMRDPAVDAMVQLAMTCAPGGGGGKAEAVRAIRECFELLELMKLVRPCSAPLPHVVHVLGRILRTTKCRRAGRLSSTHHLGLSCGLSRNVQIVVRCPSRSLNSG
jgi:hypothetical protein